MPDVGTRPAVYALELNHSALAIANLTAGAEAHATHEQGSSYEVERITIDARGAGSIGAKNLEANWRAPAHKEQDTAYVGLEANGAGRFAMGDFLATLYVSGSLRVRAVYAVASSHEQQDSRSSETAGLPLLRDRTASCGYVSV